MRRLLPIALISAAAALLLLLGADSAGPNQDRLWHHRNLGKAFYENPTTQVQAVDEFKKALDLAPDSARERLNYGLALMRAAKTKEGVAEVEKAQKQDPNIPHTWFNLGIAYKKESNYEGAIAQFEQMVKLVSDEPVSQYNLGVLYKLAGKTDQALHHFEISSRLDPNLAGPHFQLYNAYRQAGRAEEAARELKIFQEIKKRTAGAAVPEDMEWSYYAEIYETVEPKAEEAAAAELKFQDRKLADKAEGLTVLDADGDGRADLIAWSKDGVHLFRNGVTEVQDPVLAGLKGVVSISPGDFNNDGWADLCVLTDAGAALYLNQKGKFQKHAAQLPAGRFARAVWLDYDHDYDLDLFLLGEKSALARNEGQAGFADHTADFPFVAGNATAGTLYDLVADTPNIDLVVTYQDRAGVLYRDKLAGKYEAVPVEMLPAGSKSLIAFDFNNDGWTDLAAGSDSGVALAVNRLGKLERADAPAGAKGPVLFADFENRGASDLTSAAGVSRNKGLGRFDPAKAAGVPSSAMLVEADFDGDGRTDLALIAADGSAHVLTNQTTTRNNWLSVGLAGVKNLKLAPGAEVEVKAGARYQKKIYQGIPLLFGLQSFKDADTVRITWPNGLIQNEPKQIAGKAQTYKEAQRLSGSCPMIFTWNGHSFEFITDVLGVAPLGASSGDGQYFPVDHDEYVQIPGESLALVNGGYEIRVTEELREVSYLDQIRLIAVDHPAAIDIFTNDKFKSPPFPDFRLFGAERRIYPVRARDGRGADVLSRVQRRDRSYVDGFKRDYSGVAELHTLDLDFGEAARDNRAVLVLSGWVDWADGSTFLGTSQEKRGGLIFPSLQVKDSQGNWRTVIEDMGIPAGKPKTIAVDLTGKFLSQSREVRIVTNLCLYWDEIFLSDDSAPPPARLTAMDAQSADLSFGGFSKPTIHPERKQPESFDYAKRMPVSMWNPTPGRYTRYGDVRPLLESLDDRLVLMGSGDELKLRFWAQSLPRLERGWRRDYLLFVDGWAKDGDANTAYSQTVEPLPFHGMSRYPYPAGERYPEQPGERYNTRPALRLLRPLADSRF